MKKLLLMLAVLCGTVSAWAEVYKPGARTTTLEAGKKYFISVATWYGSGCTNLLYNNEDGVLTKSNLLPNSMVTDQSPYLFTVEEVGDGYLAYIKNSSDKYIQADNLASTESKTGVYVIPYFTAKAVCCGDDVDACDANGNMIDYYNITAETPIVSVQKNADYTNADNRNGWRYIGGLTAGANWCTAFAFYEAKDARPEVTTNIESPILYTVKNNRAQKYACYEENKSMTLQSTVNLGNIFYFTEGSVDGACKIHNLATNLLCASHDSWTETGIDWYILPSGNTTHVGYAISNKAALTGDTGEAWNDYQGTGTSVNYWGGNDAGSVWTIESFDAVAFMNEVAAAKANALTQIALYEESDYYTYLDDAIAAAKSTINAVEINDLPSAFEASQNIERALATLAATEKNGGPVAGDYIQLKNRQYGKFLRENGSGLFGGDANSNSSLWYVEAGEGTNVKLKNVSTGKYIGEIRQSANVAMVDEADAKQFAFTNQTDIYAVFKETSGGGYAYGHIAGHNVLVGWEPSANATQWIVSKVTLPEEGKYYFIECPLFYNVQGVKKALYSNGFNPGWKTLDAADKSFYWTVEKTDNGYVLKNANDNKYVLGNATESQAWTMNGATDNAEYTIEATGEGQVHIKITERYLHAAGHGGGAGTGSNIVSWRATGANTASAWKFIETEDPDVVLARIQLKNNLSQAIVNAQNLYNSVTIGNGVGQYTAPADIEERFATIIAFCEGIGAGTTPDMIEAKMSELEELVASVKLNMPVAGKFYRIHNDNKYITSGVTAGGRIALSETNNDAASVYYYDGTHLLAYGTGLYMGLNASDWTFEAVGSADISAIEIVAAVNGVVAKYNIKSGGCWLHRTDSWVNRCSNNTCGNAHNWTIEEVTTLPVTITSAGYATFFAPVAVQPEGVEVYYAAQANENAVSLTAIEGVIPANTGVILKSEAVILNGEANTYNFDIVADVDPVEDNKLAGTVASAYVEEDAYVLSKQGAVVGMYKAAKNQEGNTKWLNNGFKAYLPASVFTADARFLVFNFGGETAIENIQGAENAADAVVYDLAGRRVQKAQKGLYIVNGVKVIK